MRRSEGRVSTICHIIYILEEPHTRTRPHFRSHAPFRCSAKKYTSAKIIQLNECGCRDGMHHAKNRGNKVIPLAQSHITPAARNADM